MERMALFQLSLGWVPVPQSGLGMSQGSQVTRGTPASKQTTPFDLLSGNQAKNRLQRLKVKSKDVTKQCCWKASSAHSLQTSKDCVSMPEPVHLLLAVEKGFVKVVH